MGQGDIRSRKALGRRHLRDRWAGSLEAAGQRDWAKVAGEVRSSPDGRGWKRGDKEPGRKDMRGLG